MFKTVTDKEKAPCHNSQIGHKQSYYTFTSRIKCPKTNVSFNTYILRRSIPGINIAFGTKIGFYSEEELAPRVTTKLDDHSLWAVVAALHIRVLLCPQLEDASCCGDKGPT
jgi:hypothetical protein